MAKQDNRKFIPDLLPSGTIVEVVKLDNKGEFVGIKDMEYKDWKTMKKQAGFIYRCFQKGFSKFNNNVN